MSMGQKLPSGMFNNQSGFNAGYTQPYGSGSAANMSGGFGAGTYDPMLGFGQSSGMGTTYPTRYSADYTRYAQSGQDFNQPVMGYNTYGQIFSQPQPQPMMGGKGGFGRTQPPSFGGKGGGGFRQQPPAMGGKGGGGFQPGYGYQPQFPGMVAGGPGFQQINRRRPERRSNQLGLNQPPKDTGVSGSFLDFYSRQNNPANSIFEPQTGGPGATPPPLTGGVPTDSVGGFGPGQLMSDSFRRPQRDRNFNLAGGRGPEGDNTDYRPVGSNFVGILPTGDLNNDVRFSPSNPYTDDLVMSPVQANRQVIDENIYNSPFNQLIGTGVNRPPVGDTMFDTRAFENFRLNQDFGRMNFQEGGQVPPDANMEIMMAETAQPEMAGEYDRLIQMTMQAILGQVESPDEVIQMFIDEFGVDAFRQLREAVLKQQVPNAQTEGMVDGNGGGMDDQVMGMIGNQRPVAVSPGEYIVPADVVSGLGDGSSKSGADILDELNQAVRMARTGTTQQPRPLMETMQ